MFVNGGGASRARVAATVSTGLGLMAMVFAPLARSAGPRSDAGAPASPATTTAASTASPQVSGEAPVRSVRRTPKEPSWIEGGSAQAFVFPPQSDAASPKPVTVVLHGLCGHPQSACAPFVDVSTSRGWLVCPRGEDVCGAGTRWRLQGPDDARVVEASVDALRRQHAGDVEAADARVLVGFSLGGIAAVQIAQSSSPGKYEGLVIIASQVHPDAGALRRAGIKRVVLAAGDLDMTSAPLRSDARALDGNGLPTRFVSLGRFGHGYPADMEERMREPMQWVSSAGP